MERRKGGVVVVQEIFGVTDHIRDICNRFAAEGYEALAPSLYDRLEHGFEIKGPVTPDAIAQGRALMEKTPWDQVGADLQAAIDRLTGPVFVTGFCWGGAAAWFAASHCRNVSAASCFYGRAIVSLLGNPPRAPVMLHYGKKDASIPPGDIAEVHNIYPHIPMHMYDAGHGFCREGGHDFHAPSRDLGLQRTFEFFAAHEKGQGDAA